MKEGPCRFFPLQHGAYTIVNVVKYGSYNVNTEGFNSSMFWSDVRSIQHFAWMHWMDFYLSLNQRNITGGLYLS